MRSEFIFRLSGSRYTPLFSKRIGEVEESAERSDGEEPKNEEAEEDDQAWSREIPDLFVTPSKYRKPGDTKKKDDVKKKSEEVKVKEKKDEDPKKKNEKEEDNNEDAVVVENEVNDDGGDEGQEEEEEEEDGGFLSSLFNINLTRRIGEMLPEVRKT